VANWVKKTRETVRLLALYELTHSSSRGRKFEAISEIDNMALAAGMNEANLLPISRIALNQKMDTSAFNLFSSQAVETEMKLYWK
jgi:hypothetical protein